MPYWTRLRQARSAVSPGHHRVATVISVSARVGGRRTADQAWAWTTEIPAFERATDAILLDEHVTSRRNRASRNESESGARGSRERRTDHAYQRPIQCGRPTR